MKAKKITFSIFFWTKKEPEKTFSEKIAEAVPELLKYLPELRRIMRQPTDPTIETDGKIIGQMYDFYGEIMENTMAIAPLPLDWDTQVVKEKGTDQRIEAKPKDIENQLAKMPTPWTIKDLDKKIALLKDKTALSNQRYVSAQIDGMIKRLENRRGYAAEHAFYEQFLNTSDERIDDLLAKYKLVVRPVELFVPTFPEEAIAVMKQYNEVTKKVCGEKAVFYVIAEAVDFEKKQKRLDPILLAQSPFGFYWQVLGAWDKEMILLSEL